MNILVTGATGFIGKNLVKNLVKNNHTVKCLVRKTSRKGDVDYLNKLKAQLFYGDITRKETLKNCLDNIDVVYHLAGVLGNFDIPKEDYYKIHVLGTKNLLELCKKQKFIYCSSAGVLGPVFNGNELSAINPTNSYEKSKYGAEKIVRKYHNYIIIRPEFVYGPKDMHVLPLFKAVKEKKFFIIGNGKSLLHPTYIDDLISCLVNCSDKKIKNEIFIIAGEKPVSVEEFVKLVADKFDVGYNKIKIPIIFAGISSLFLEPLGKTIGFEPILTRSRIDFFTKTRSFDINKAKKTLKYKPIRLEKGIEETIGWYKANGYL